VRRRTIEALQATSAAPNALEQLSLSVGQTDQLALNLALATAPSARADRIYTGVLYEALGFASMSAAAKRRAGTRVAIISSVFGVVRPQDRIAPYRLAGGVNLPGIGPVARWWRTHLGETMARLGGTGLIVDLRSSTYAAFWRPTPEMAHRVATIRVLHEVDGKRSIVSHFNKATKGRIVRALLEDGAAPRTPAALAQTLQRLGWHVELGEIGPLDVVLDVVVTQI